MVYLLLFVGLVDIVVLDDNQQYILQQPQGQTGNAEFILPPELTGGEGKLHFIPLAKKNIWIAGYTFSNFTVV